MEIMEITKKQYYSLYCLTKRTIVVDRDDILIEITMIPEDSLLLKVIDLRADKKAIVYKIFSDREESRWKKTLEYLAIGDTKIPDDCMYPLSKERIYG